MRLEGKGRHIRGTLTPPRPPRRSRTLLRARKHPRTGAAARRGSRPLLHGALVAGLVGFIVTLGFFPVTVPGHSAQPTLSVGTLTLPGLAANAPTVAVTEFDAGPQPLTIQAPAVTSDVLASANDQTEDSVASIQNAQAAAAQATGIVTAASQGGQERIPIFYEYEVREGDTLTSIADRFAIDPQYIVWNNLDIEDENSLIVGQSLQIPSVEGIIHAVRIEETVSDIASRYDADAQDIIEFTANGLSNPNLLSADSLILVPGGRILPPPPAPSLAPTLPTTPSETPGEAVPGPAVGPGGWGWPLSGGLLTSPFGPGHPLGIDVAAPVGTPVYASSSGTISFTGGNACCSYGYHVIIDHGDGYESLYGHLSGFNVSPGQQVAAGDVVGWIGMTGRTTGPHVHFEIRRNGSYQDPMLYLD